MCVCACVYVNVWSVCVCVCRYHHTLFGISLHVDPLDFNALICYFNADFHLVVNDFIIIIFKIIQISTYFQITPIDDNVTIAQALSRQTVCSPNRTHCCISTGLRIDVAREHFIVDVHVNVLQPPSPCLEAIFLCKLETGLNVVVRQDWLAAHLSEFDAFFS